MDSAAAPPPTARRLSEFKIDLFPILFIRKSAQLIFNETKFINHVLKASAARIRNEWISS